MSDYNFRSIVPYSTKLIRAWYASANIKPIDMQAPVTGNTRLNNLPRTIAMNIELAKINSTNVYGTMPRTEGKRFNYQVLTFYKREPLRFESFEWSEISRNVMRLYRPSIKITRSGVRVKPF